MFPNSYVDIRLDLRCLSEMDKILLEINFQSFDKNVMMISSDFVLDLISTLSKWV